jgi:hypothetical protein
LKSNDAANTAQFSPVGFWLVPAPRDHPGLSAIIDGLARELDAPRFEPHVTLYAGARGAHDDVEGLLARATQGVGMLDLRVTGVGTSPELFKTLYLEFEPDLQAERLCQLFRTALTPGLDYVLRPHLSLLYKRLPETTRTALAKRFVVVGQRITFAQITAVRPGDGDKDWSAIEKWDAWLRKDLGGPVATPR